MITINNNIGNFEATLISPKGEELGIITNIVSLTDVRRQIKKEQDYGYKLKVDGTTVLIDRDGNLSEYPEALNYYVDILFDLI